MLKMYSNVCAVYQICDKIQGMKVWDIINTGKRTNVGLREGMSIEDVNCALCGQCITHCPVGALRERDDLNELVYAIADKKKVVVAQIAPAVRAAWGERFGLKREDATVKRLVAALRRTGIDYVFDTNFTADLTIMEEANEFIERLKNKDKYKFPMFTSCCPGWVRFVKYEYPELLPNLPRKIPAADVWSNCKNLLCTAVRCGAGRNLLSVDHAMYSEKIRKPDGVYGCDGNRTGRRFCYHHERGRTSDPCRAYSVRAFKRRGV